MFIQLIYILLNFLAEIRLYYSSVYLMLTYDTCTQREHILPIVPFCRPNNSFVWCTRIRLMLCWAMSDWVNGVNNPSLIEFIHSFDLIVKMFVFGSANIWAKDNLFRVVKRWLLRPAPVLSTATTRFFTNRAHHILLTHLMHLYS